MKKSFITSGPGYFSFGNKKGADQPACLLSLICSFVFPHYTLSAEEIMCVFDDI